METKLNGLRTDLGKGGAGLVQAGDPHGLYAYLETLGATTCPPVATTTALAAVAAVDRSEGMLAMVLADNSLWRFDAGSTASASASVVVPDAGTGRWIRVNTGGTSVSGNVADLTALKAIAAANRYTGMVAMVQADGSLWRFAAASTLTGDDMLVAAPAAGTGKWIRVDKSVDITAEVTKDTADAAVLYTVPAGFVLGLGVPWQHVTTSWTGGSSSAIGCSSSNAGLSTKGDLLGGATGDVAAGLLSTGAYAKGTVGAKIGKPGAVLVGGETILHDKITSAFTAGAGVDHFPVTVLVAPAS